MLIWEPEELELPSKNFKSNSKEYIKQNVLYRPWQVTSAVWVSSLNRVFIVSERTFSTKSVGQDTGRIYNSSSGGMTKELGAVTLLTTDTQVITERIRSFVQFLYRFPSFFTG